MTPAQIEIARRAMALPGWEWRAGMLARSVAMTEGGYEFNARIIDDARDPDGGFAGPINVHGGRFYADYECGPSNEAEFADDDPEATYANPEYGVGEEYAAIERFVVHLDDPTGATDGALLRLLGDADIVMRIRTDRVWGQYFDAQRNAWPSIMDASTRAEFCCRVALAVGRWPGGAR